MYDPEVAFGGHQPLLFDQMSAHFQHFTVLGSKIHIRVFKDAAITWDPDPVDLCLALQSTDSSVTDAFAEREQPGTSYGTLTHGQAPTVILNKGFSAKKFFGKKHPGAESELRGSDSADPSELAYYILSATDRESMSDGSTNTTF